MIYKARCVCVCVCLTYLWSVPAAKLLLQMFQIQQPRPRPVSTRTKFIYFISHAWRGCGQDRIRRATELITWHSSAEETGNSVQVITVVILYTVATKVEGGKWWQLLPHHHIYIYFTVTRKAQTQWTGGHENIKQQKEKCKNLKYKK